MGECHISCISIYWDMQEKFLSLWYVCINRWKKRVAFWRVTEKRDVMIHKMHMSRIIDKIFNKTNVTAKTHRLNNFVYLHIFSGRWPKARRNQHQVPAAAADERRARQVGADRSQCVGDCGHRAAKLAARGQRACQGRALGERGRYPDTLFGDGKTLAQCCIVLGRLTWNVGK